MVQIKLPDNEKEPSTGGTSLLPTMNTEVMRGTVITKRSSPSGLSLTSLVLIVLALIFTLTSVKKICDLKEQNVRLIQQLALERQKDAVLKLAVRDNIPQTRFIQHRFNPKEVNEVEYETSLDEPKSSWSINLSVLWTSPKITPCDMVLLSHILAEEIYSHQDEQMKQRKSWNEESDADAEDDVSTLLNFLDDEIKENKVTADSSEEDDSSEEEHADYPWNEPIKAESEEHDYWAGLN